MHLSRSQSAPSVERPPTCVRASSSTQLSSEPVDELGITGNDSQPIRGFPRFPHHRPARTLPRPNLGVGALLLDLDVVTQPTRKDLDHGFAGGLLLRINELELLEQDVAPLEVSQPALSSMRKQFAVLSDAAAIVREPAGTVLLQCRERR